MISIDLRKAENFLGYSYFITPYVDELNGLGKFFGKEYEIQNTKITAMLDALLDYEITSPRKDVLKKLNELKAPVLKEKEDVVKPNFKLKPHKHQLEGVKYMLAHERCIIGDEMGLGKSGMTVFAVEILKAHYEFKHCLIVCGINGAKDNWNQIEIPKFSHEKSHIIGSRINTKGNMIVGSNEDKYKDLLEDHEEFYLIINAEALRYEKTIERLQNMVAEGDIGVVVIDELHKFSGHTSSQGKAIQKLRPKFRFGLTGTPVKNKPLGIYNLLLWIGVERRTFSEFRESYFTMIKQQVRTSRGIQVFEDWRPANLDKLHELLAEHMIRRTVEVLQLPDPVFKTEYVELYKSQLDLYDQLKKEAYAELGEQTTLEGLKIGNPAVFFTRARQAVSAPSALGLKQDAKLDRTVELCEEIIENDKSVVIFTWFTASTRSYYERLSKEFEGQVLVVDDKTPNVQDVISDFENNPKRRIIIGNIAKLGISYTITKASYVIFVEKHVVWSDYRQAYMRVWRQGQTKTVFIIDLMAKNVIDERLHYLVQLGKSHSEQVVDGKSPEDIIYTHYRLSDIL